VTVLQNCLVTPSSVAEGAVNVKSFGVAIRIAVMCRFLQNAKESNKLRYDRKIAINHVKFADVKIYYVMD